MFEGYTDETFEFFMAIRFNNNTDFFHTNHDWYARAVREPSLRLAEALSDTVEWLDENLERRPNRVVSRINRDLRFSKDKSPYRDYIWLSFRYPGEMHSLTPEIYFSLSAEGASMGFGIYGENRPMMDALRRRFRVEPQGFLECLTPLLNDFTPFVRCFKRMAVPEDLHPALKMWYPLKSFYLERPMKDFELLKSPELADFIASGIRQLAPLHRYMRTCE